MTSDETIRKAAEVLHSRYCEHAAWRTPCRGPDSGDMRAARALDAAGLLAPDMREEWGIRWDDGSQWTEGYKTRAEADVSLGPGDTVIRRHVTEWETA